MVWPLLLLGLARATSAEPGRRVQHAAVVDSHLLQMFPRGGVMVPDSEMPAVAHLNEFRDVCVERRPWTESGHWLVLLNGTEADLEQSRRGDYTGCESLEPNWNGDGRRCGMVNFAPSYRRAEDVSGWPWVPEPTAALAFFSTNPGHFVSDVIWSLLPRFFEDDPFTQTWLAGDPGCERWMCRTTQAYYRLKTGLPAKVLKTAGPTCFKTLYIPQLTRWRWQPDEVPNLEVSTQLREALVAGFRPPRDDVLIYGHEDGNGRRWRSAAEFQHLLEDKGYHVNRITNFGALSSEQQCEAFYNAKVILVSHGGQMGNLLCARHGAQSVEMTCEIGLGWFTTADKYQRIMGIRDRFLHVPEEFCSSGTEKDRLMQSWSWPASGLWSALSEMGVFK